MAPDPLAMVTAGLRCLPAEAAHHATIAMLRTGMVWPLGGDDPVLEMEIWGRRFANPLGIAAGFDKNAEAFGSLLTLGAGFVEVGTLTPRPQSGNPKPRLFRLPEDGAVINRLGFNNAGLSAALPRLARRRRDRGLVGINVGANRDSADPTADYEQTIALATPEADYLTINVSSPNTPGLRDLQAPAALAALLERALQARRAAAQEAGCACPPLCVKLAPDLTPDALAAIADTILAAGQDGDRVDGIIVTNTTVARPPGLRSRHAAEAGGLSGVPLVDMAEAVLRQLAPLVRGRAVLIAAGGIHDGQTAWRRITAGAQLLQLYTALIYQGPGALARIKRDLAERVRAAGLRSLSEAVGTALADGEPGKAA